MPKAKASINLICSVCTAPQRKRENVGKKTPGHRNRAGPAPEHFSGTGGHWLGGEDQAMGGHKEGHQRKTKGVVVVLQNTPTEWQKSTRSNGSGARGKKDQKPTPSEEKKKEKTTVKKNRPANGRANLPVGTIVSCGVKKKNGGGKTRHWAGPDPRAEGPEAF